MQQLLTAMIAVRDGDFSVQLPPHWEGLDGKLADTFNEIVAANRRLADDLAKVSTQVGGAGQTRARVSPANRQGQWAAMEDSVNTLIRDMTRPVEAMTEAMAAAVEIAAPRLERGRHVLRRELPDEPLPLDADHDRLAQVFSNLLGNAAKYSPPGQPIEISVASEGGRGRTAIRDHGIGLTDEQAARVFDLFAQVDTSIERSHGGLGIGLTLMRKLVEMHGGSVRVDSAGLGLGCRFVVDLPLGHAQPARAPSPPPLPVPKGSRALVLDDNRDAADTLALALQVFGLDVRTLYDPMQAEAVAAQFDPDLVFMDIGMPGMSGFTLARQLRNTQAGRRRVLVAVTGWGQPEDQRRTAEAGFDHHLVKPPDLGLLRAICAAAPPPRAQAAP